MGDDEKSVRLAMFRFVTGEFRPREFETWVYGSRTLEQMLGSAAFADIAAQDFGASDVASIRKRVRQEFDRLWPGDFDRARARAACEAVVSGSMDLVRGCQVLARLAADGVEGVGSEFVAWDSEFDGVPTAAEYPLWDPDALRAKLSFVDAHRDEILADARETLARLSNRC